MTRPLVQIDDEIREMNDKEYEQHLRDLERNPPIMLGEQPDEVPGESA